MIVAEKRRGVGAPQLFRYDVPLINQQGEIAGRLRVMVELLVGGRRVRMRLLRALDLPASMNNLVFLQYYASPGAARPTVVTAADSYDAEVIFNHTCELDLAADDDADEDEDRNIFSVAVLSHRADIAKPMKPISSSPAKSNQPNEMSSHVQKAMADAWAKVSRSFEMCVRLWELNGDGNWEPVEIRQEQQAEFNETGGIYQLKHGQSRQISMLCCAHFFRILPSFHFWGKNKNV